MTASRPRTNADIARTLLAMARALEAARVPFKPRAYERAAVAIQEMEEPVSELHAAGGIEALRRIPGVGSSIARAIEELLATGSVGTLDRLHAEHPPELSALADVRGVGRERARILWETLGIRSIDDLEHAASEGRLHGLPRFGGKTLERIARSLEMRREHGNRQLLAKVLPVAERLAARVRKLPGAARVEIAGDARRRTEEISILDVVGSSAEPLGLAEAFGRLPEVDRVVESGPGFVRAVLGAGIEARLFAVTEGSFGAALLWATGSEAHLAALRARASRAGMELGPDGLRRGTERIAAAEDAIYGALGLPSIAPELREGTGEIEAALAGTLPEPIAPGAIRGDLQIQTNATDGASSVLEMAREARRLGREYIAITDHTRDLAMVGGADEAALLAQAAEIRAMEGAVEGLRILTGAEVNVRRDGTLDVADEVLATLDVVGAGVHSFFDLPRDETTARMVRAMENPNVDILFHPSCRLLGRRRAVDFDLEAILEAAVRTGTILEIDAHPHRLDLCDRHVRRAVDFGAKLAVDSDAHRLRELAFPEMHGVSVARRGWAEAKHVVNTLPLDAFLATLKGR